ncbi:MAG: hypothetical protein ABI851_16340 [Saprospiraceae bacterium]
MHNLDKDTLIKILTGFAVVLSALLAGILGFFVQWKLKQVDNSLLKKKEKENQKIKFHIPLLRNLYELDDRFDKIFKTLHTNWLNGEYLTDIKNKKGFAETPNNKGYFIISSIYLIGVFFGLTEAIKKGVDTTRLINKKNLLQRLYYKVKNLIKRIFGFKTNKNIFQFDPDIAKVRKLFQYEELFKEYIAKMKLDNPKDASILHKHIQQSIGEMMLEKDGEEKYKIKSFSKFFKAYINDESFRFWFVLIENLFIDLTNFDKNSSIEQKIKDKNDIRPLRILAIQYWNRMLMQNISKELNLSEFNLQTRPPEELLTTLSNELKNTLINYTLSESETYLMGLNLNK